MQRSRQCGISFIELLTCLAIISVLAAIIAPIITSAKWNGYKANSLSNSKQIAMACLLYAGSNDNEFARSNDLGNGYWLGQVGLVHGNQPAVSEPGWPIATGDRLETWYYRLDAGYGLNSCLFSEEEASMPSTTIMTATVGLFYARFGDGSVMRRTFLLLGGPDEVLVEQANAFSFQNAKLFAVGGYGATRYFGKGVYSFLDGRVALLSPKEIRYATPRIESCKPATLTIYSLPEGAPSFSVQ